MYVLRGNLKFLWLILNLLIDSNSVYQKDYILRIIEMAAKVLAAILGQIKGGDLHEAAEGLENFYYDILKEDAAFFREIPGEKLTETLLSEHNYTNGHLEILAELFYAEAELCAARKNSSGMLEYSQKSFILFRFIDTEYKTYSEDRFNKMKKLLERINLVKDKN